LTARRAEIEEVGAALPADGLNPPEGMAYVGCFPDLDPVRSLSISPGKVYEDIGDPLSFEPPLRTGGRRPDPLALGRTALHAFFGFRLEGTDSVDDVDPEVIPLVGYRIS
jgi:hypothetical protein